MKFLSLVFAVLFCSNLFASEKSSLLFIGSTEEGQSCSLSVNTYEDGLIEVIHLQLNEESFYFYNHGLDSAGLLPKEINGVFENRAPEYPPIIGAPIFGMGGYVRLNIVSEYSTQKLESLKIERIDQFAYVFGVMETGRTSIFCQ